MWSNDRKSVVGTRYFEIRRTCASLKRVIRRRACVPQLASATNMLLLKAIIARADTYCIPVSLYLCIPVYCIPAYLCFDPAVLPTCVVRPCDIGFCRHRSVTVRKKIQLSNYNYVVNLSTKTTIRTAFSIVCWSK